MLAVEGILALDGADMPAGAQVLAAWIRAQVTS